MLGRDELLRDGVALGRIAVVSMPTPSFCGLCGAKLVERFLENEERTRLVCVQCGAVSYRSPQVLVSTIVAAGGRVLFCRRACPPAEGLWAPPGGFMECGEALEEAAARETFEETGVHIPPMQLRLHAVSTLPDISEVYVGFVAEVAEDVRLVCGSECSAVRFFHEADVPWDKLAYPDIGGYLRLYFNEHRAGENIIHFSRLNSAGVVRTAYRISGIETMKLATPRTTR